MSERAIYRDAHHRFTVAECDGEILRFGIEGRNETTDPWIVADGSWLYCDVDDARAISELIAARVKEIEGRK